MNSLDPCQFIFFFNATEQKKKSFILIIFKYVYILSCDVKCFLVWTGDQGILKATESEPYHLS
jgi:hypothetical protein